MFHMKETSPKTRFVPLTIASPEKLHLMLIGWVERRGGGRREGGDSISLPISDIATLQVDN